MMELNEVQEFSCFDDSKELREGWLRDIVRLLCQTDICSRYLTDE